MFGQKMKSELEISKENENEKVEAAKAAVCPYEASTLSNSSLSLLQTSNNMPSVSISRLPCVSSKDRFLTPSILVFSMTISTLQRQPESLQENSR